MALTQYMPGMKPGSTIRNVIIGVVYIILFPLMVFVLIGGLAYHTAKNTNGLADGLSAIPGVSEGGGALSGVVVFVGLFVLLAGVGGILGAGGGDDTPNDAQQATSGGSEEVSTNSNAATDVSTQEPTPNPTTTPSLEPTATQTPNNPTHSVGESFVVGSGEQAIRYTVTGVQTTESVGTDSVGEDADGLFVLVTLEMENTGSESLDLTSRPFRLVDQQDREFEVDDQAMLYVDESVVFEQLNPGLSKQGVIVFDVAPDGDYRLRIEPSGLFSTARIHYVEIDI